MPTLDDCISAVYEPGNIPTDTGDTPTVPTLLEPSLDFSKYQNSQYSFLLFAW
jgi:hypothetical protein